MANALDGEQLPEFRVSSESSALALPAAPVAADALPKQHTYKMRKASYDKLLATHPAAVLSYLDADDGEKITVGSGLELEQRLHEPAVTTARRGASNARPMSMHNFDIRADPGVHDVWESRYQQEQSRVPTNQGEGQTTSPQQKVEEVKQDLQDHIGRLAAKMDVTTLDQAPEILSEPRSDYLEKGQPPMLTAMTDTALPQRPAPITSGEGTLTTEGQKMARQAAAAMTPKLAPPRGNMVERHNQTTPSLENRWASYGALNASFKPTPAELAGATPSPRVELDTNKADGQPLLQMFESELAKIAKASSTDGNDCNLLQASSTANKSTTDGKAAGINETTPKSNPANHAEAATQSIKTFLQTVGELAAQAIDHDSTLSQQLATTGKEVQSRLNLAMGNGVKAAIPEVTRMPLSELDERTPEMFRIAKTTSNAGLAWINDVLDNSEHQMTCLIRCKVGQGPCPVRRTIMEAAQLIEQQSESSACPREAVSEAANELPPTSQSHQSTQTNSKESELIDGKALFEADRILAKRYVSYNHMWGPSKLQYLVRWVGHGPEHDVWYDSENLGGCKGLVKHYEKAQAKHAVELSQDELHTVHFRTAGDRMVASRKWEESEEIDNHRRFHTDETFRQKQLKDLRYAQSTEHQKAKTVEDSTKTTTVEARSSSLDAKVSASALNPASHSTLRHRKSWHPSSSTTAFQRTVSPTAAAQRYPAISSFEAAHRNTKEDCRKSFPLSGREPDLSKLPYSLDFPHLEESRLAWLDDPSQGPSQKDKSVRFELVDPWIEKKKAQAQWESKQNEEQSLYGAPEPATSAKKEGKKAARYSSPPPPKPASEAPPLPTNLMSGHQELSSGKIWEELNRNAQLRRAKSLNLPKLREYSSSAAAPFRRSGLRFCSSDEPTAWRNTAPTPMRCPIGNDFFGPIRPKRDPPWLRRSASFRQTTPREDRTSSNKRDESSVLGSNRSTTGQDKDFQDDRKLKAATNTSNPAPSSFEDIFGVNPWIQDRLSEKDPWAFLNDHAKDESSRINFPAMTPQKPANIAVAAKGASAASTMAAPGIARRPSMRTFEELPPTVRARGERIRSTMDRLVVMGFGTQEARTVSESVDGNMDLALDMLEEDREARERGFEKEVERKWPGAF